MTEESPTPITSSPLLERPHIRHRRVSRHHRRSASFTLPRKTAPRVRKLTANSAAQSEDEDLPAGIMDNSLVKNYWENADELLERFVTNVQSQAGHLVHNVQRKAGTAAHNATEMVHHAEEMALDFYLRLRDWKACHFEKLPNWLKDNEHLHFGHRPEIPSFAECFRSIFRIHTETGNIWTHLVGFILFVIVTVVFYIKPLCDTCQLDIQISEKLIFACFFLGAIVCLACSTIFHTVCCHSEWASTIFSRLDYAGIAVLIVGSIIPWLYYGFYCHMYTRWTYSIAIAVLGLLTVILTLWDRFNLPDFRVYRAAVFVALGSVAVVPVVHHIILNGVQNAYMEASVHCTIIMGALYLTGAVLYAARIPERFYPGKCDIWFQSHQIFHILVIVAAFVHYRGISEMAIYRLSKQGKCDFDVGDNPVASGSGAIF
ncbi:hypothetical protein TCAL_04458 [Tigriopus californicus]|uniref:Adiponectin receptor n=1 Tax=Tigriopus californicus TaxID=6832 RepID=A0A553NZP5_TIGCA|nr:adiponectin receptor protein 1-like [Tigriopus californicus]XP_059092085.1 adiponectin receptor protein 1-like [Tigriopus californicus]XP_059092086.1 adiponectin receptor protein 1-like [Tigriopus californicus]XP_059092087.1 adiponectin receptor protein 1-like [Tigriopus californicus]TRY70895.1 hypothetical protein TCAL_04458 [Tigriopus californicus]|eukprot:TCALIF_04458-PA protein Name:"Similar to AdipoR Adiponectin receptor protein (Drosophila melanogaster)" AED:0.06 eAED:0.06 QI:0/-1/0/1/-1/1/1/0/429